MQGVHINFHDHSHAIKIQEHFYHVLKVSNNRSPCNKEKILPDSDVPELPPPLKPDSQDTDIPPVYQDIKKLSCKPNNMADYEHCYYQEVHDLNDNVGTPKSHQQEVKFVLCVYTC